MRAVPGVSCMAIRSLRIQLRFGELSVVGIGFEVEINRDRRSVISRASVACQLGASQEGYGGAGVE